MNAIYTCAIFDGVCLSSNRCYFVGAATFAAKCSMFSLVRIMSCASRGDASDDYDGDDDDDDDDDNSVHLFLLTIMFVSFQFIIMMMMMMMMALLAMMTRRSTLRSTSNEFEIAHKFVTCTNGDKNCVSYELLTGVVGPRTDCNSLACLLSTHQ
mgnify:FL=1